MEKSDLKKNLKHLLLDLRQMKSFCEKPLIIKKAKGIYLTDVEGKKYIDGISGIFVVNIGHGNEYVKEAIARQQEKVSFVAPLHAVSDTTIEYASSLVEITPEGLNTVKFLSGGSEATETAMKFTRQYFQQKGKQTKYKIISNYKGYHGATLGALAASGLGGIRKAKFGPFPEGFLHLPPPTCFRCPYELTYPDCRILCARMLKTVIANEGQDSIAAFIVEPIGNTGGIITPPEEYFKIIRKTCDEFGVILIFDEIITGMGRTRNWFAADTFQTVPDILCLGKGMASGYSPLAAAVIRDSLYFDAFWGPDSANIQFSHGHTFGGNPVSAAAGLAVLEVIRKQNLIKNGQIIGDYIRERLKREIGELGILGEVRGKGCLIGIEFVEDMESKKSFAPERMFGKKVEQRMLDKGLILRCDPDWIAIGPPLITDKGQADEIISILISSLKEELKA